MNREINRRVWRKSIASP